jgi:two-component system response regulator RegA
MIARDLPGAGTGLLVDDDPLFLKALQRALLRHGLHTATAQSCAEALASARIAPPAFAVIDLRLESESGLDLIGPLKSLRADMRVVLLTGYASVATAVEAIKRGADDYLPKPATATAVLLALRGDAAAEPAPPAVMTPLSRLEWEHIQQALKMTGGNISATARLLGMHRRSLQRKLAKRPGPEFSKS